MVKATKSPAKKKPAVKKPKKAYTDGTLSFKSKSLLDYHLHLKSLHSIGQIKSFEVPTVDNKSKNKLGAIKVMVDDIVFDSMLESRYYLYLLQQVAEGNIKSFHLQPSYELIPRFQKVIDGKKKTFRKMEYVADFLVTHLDDTQSIVDTKGMLTEVFKIKRKLFEFKYPELTLRVVIEKGGKWIDI